MLKLFFIVACLCVALLGDAATLKTTDGIEYKNYEIVEPRHNGLAIMHDLGIEVIPYDKLPTDLRNKYAHMVERLKAKEVERQKKMQIYRKKSEEQKKYQNLLKYLPKITFYFSTIIIGQRIRIVRVLDDNRVLAEHDDIMASESRNQFVITDLNTKNMSDGTILKKGKEKEIRLFYIGTSQQYLRGQRVGQVWKFTASEKVAIEILKKNPNIQAPYIYWAIKVLPKRLQK